MIAYFDTQTFDHVYKKIGCTAADIANLRKAIYGRRLSIRMSVHALEEILLGRKVSPQAFAAQIKLTLSLASSRTLVKPCAQLVFDDIRAYADRGEADRPFLRGDMQNAVADGIAALIESDGEELEDEFLAVLEQARQDKQHFFAALQQARQEAEAISRPATGWSSFEQYFEAAALPALAMLAKQTGADEACRERGLDGLLELKSVRMSLCMALAPGFEQVTAGAANSSTAHHAVSAAAVAETYVSDTAANPEFLALVPVAGLHVSSLPEFLKHLPGQAAPESA
jgi:hypothetical protein